MGEYCSVFAKISKGLVHCRFCQCVLIFIVKAEIIDGVTDLRENETNPVNFTCKAIGEPPPTINWYFNDVMINLLNISKCNAFNSSNGTVFTSLLTIVNIQSPDVGTYTCYAANTIGFDQSSGMLIVNSK